MLKEDITTKSKTIWALLFDKGKLSIKEIEKMTKCKKTIVFISLGWLLKEGKIRFINENGILYAMPDDCVTDIYY